MSGTKHYVQPCEDESTLFGQFSRMYFTGLATLPWRTQLISGALPLNAHVRPLVSRLSGTRTTELQALLWPHIQQRYNVFFIDNPLFAPPPPVNYENTMDSGFVVPMLLRIAESCGKRYLGQLFTEGPLAVVVCSTMAESLVLVEAIRNASQQFDRAFRVVNIYERTEDRNFPDKAYMATQECDVLIVLLHSLPRLFTTQGRAWAPPINLLKVELAVFRNVDVMLKTDPLIVEQALTRFLVNPETNYVFAASAPSVAVKRLLGKLENVMCTVISNFLDAILYEKMPIQLMESNSKLPSSVFAQKTYSDRSPGEKIILFVGTDKDALELKKAAELPQKGSLRNIYDFQVVSAKDSIYDSASVIQNWWKPDQKDQIRILAIPNKFAGDFGINDADLIVHLAAPDNLQQFMKRFCCIKKSFMGWSSTYASLAKPKGQGDKIAFPPIACRIVVDKDWEPLLPLLIKAASGSMEYSIIPPNIVATSQKALQRPEFLRVPLCLQQLYLGECVHRGSCGYRHYEGPKIPLPTVLSSKECTKFEFTIMRFLNPTHFVVRIIKLQLANGTAVMYDRLQKDLDEGLRNTLDQLPEPFLETPPVDAVCGMLSEDKSRLYRVQLLQIIDKDSIHVHYLDEGIGMTFAADDRKHTKLSARVQSGTQFYPLPDEIRTAGKTWINVILASVRPSSQELYWQPAVCGAVYGALRVHIEEKTVMEAAALYATEDFVFIDNFKSWKTQEGRSNCIMNMQNILQRKTSFVLNPTHLSKLAMAYEEEDVSNGKSLTFLLPSFSNMSLGDTSVEEMANVGDLAISLTDSSADGI